ncbi:unnamed protein product [Trichobilharzia szidati]|nr:unnamed protein product [Trichobilharzia szidati]
MELNKDFDYHEIVRETLHNISNTGEGIQSTIKNRIFIPKSIEIDENFNRLLLDTYKAEIEKVPFKGDRKGSIIRVNEWIKQIMNMKYHRLSISSFPDNISTVITSTAYFKGLWKHVFEEDKKRACTFQRLDGSSKNITFLHTIDEFESATFPELKSCGVKIPLLDSQWTVLILLPDEENGLPELINTLRRTNGFVKLIESPFYSLKLNLYIPKLCIKFNNLISIKKLLQRMNINDAFDIMSANLSNMASSPNDNVYISEIFHCASFEINEMRTSSCNLTRFCGKKLTEPADITMKVDHPFFLIILWNNEIPVYLGHIIEPEN